MAELNILRTRCVSAELAQRLAGVENDLDEGLVPAWVFGNDPEVYALERERLFPRVWSFIGHVSELPEVGDHVIRYIGEDSFIFIRSSDGEIRLFFNACRHRVIKCVPLSVVTRRRFSARITAGPTRIPGS